MTVPWYLSILKFLAVHFCLAMDVVVGEIVQVAEFRRPSKGARYGSKVLGGIARVVAVGADATVDLNFYLENRRALAVAAFISYSPTDTISNQKVSKIGSS